MQDGSHAQILLLLYDDKDEIVEGHTYSLAGTACAIVIERGELCEFPYPAVRFPTDEALPAMGVKHYADATLVRHHPSSGHLFLLHDFALSFTSLARVRKALEQAAGRVARGIEHERHVAVIGPFPWLAGSNGLTGLPEHVAMRAELSLQLEIFEQGVRKDALFVYISLRGLRRLPQLPGGLTRAALLQDFARTLRRMLRLGQDTVFHLGDGLFGVLIDAPRPRVSRALLERRQRLQVHLAALQVAGVEVCIDAASLSALRFRNLDDWLSAATSALGADAPQRPPELALSNPASGPVSPLINRRGRSSWNPSKSHS